jgi:hypothetical protein
VAWYEEQWRKVKEGSARLYTGTRHRLGKAYTATRDRVRSFNWRKPPKTLLIWTGSIVGAFVVAFVALNILLANPTTGTPMINWALGTFGGKDARVQVGHLQHPFSNRFMLQTLAMPGTLTAREMDVYYDLFGWLPGRVWAERVRIRDGDILLENRNEQNAGQAFNPAQWINNIDAENVAIRFTSAGKPRLVTVVTANGSFANGSVRAEAIADDSRLTFDGLQRDWGGSMKGRVTAKGQNIKDLAAVVGASAPDTPPFNIEGNLSVQQFTWSIEDLTGRVGDSDLAGRMSINLSQKKPMLGVDLRSARLDFDDLGVVFGIPLGTGEGETANAEQKRAKEAFDRSARLIPNAEIDFSRLAAVNADINFVAAKVVDAPAGINALTLKGTLRDSVLDFEQALVKTGAGDLDAKININATKDPAVTKTSGQLSKIAFSKVGAGDMLRGTMNGRFNLTLTGSGFRQAAATATGEAGFWSTNSEMKKFLVEGAGLDLGEMLLIWATEDKDNPEYIRSRCLAANVAFKDGRATLQPAIIENSDSLIAATGAINLKDESIDIEIFARPHDVSIGTISGDIKLDGTLRNPGFEALNEETLLQAGLSAILGSISGALGFLPFVETGGEPEAPCATLLADAKETSTRRNPAANVKPEKS